jgi:hypothetical protein
LAAATKPASLATALLAVQSQALTFQKDKVNPAFKGSRYASTDSILAALLPVLTANSLVLTQMPSSVGPEPALTTRITYAPTGEYIESTGLLVLDKQNAQGLGGAITYMRRYAVCAFFGLVEGEDDDGNSASKSERKVEVVNRRSKAKASAASGAEDY